MASVEPDPPLEPHVAEETVPELLSEDESPAAPTHTVDSKPPVTPPRKTTVPPKRPLTTAKRPVAPTPSTAAKATATRTALGSGLSKPPTRPPVSSTTRRAGGATTASTHKARASTSSADDTRKGPTSPLAENRKPTASGFAKRASIAPSVTSKAADPDPKVTANTSRRTTIGSSSAAERRPTTSVTKDGLKQTTSNARALASSTTPRAPRISAATTRSVPTSTNAEVKKRLSTIPASPITRGSGTTPTSSPRSLVKPIRPALGTRKSTMSTTMEQRLKEMDLVHTMLKAAMAEDGDEDDEVKEEISRQMEENLAELKGKLEEARRNEGKGAISPSVTQEEGKPQDVATESDQLQLELKESQEKIVRLEGEITTTREEVRRSTEDTQQTLRDVEAVKEGVREEQTTRINEIMTAHSSELEALRNELSGKIGQLTTTHATEVENLKAEHTDKIDQLILEQEEKSKALKEQAAKVEDLTARHGDDLRELQAKHTASLDDMTTVYNKQSESTKAEHGVALDKLASESKNEIEALKLRHDADLDQVTTNLGSEIESLKTKLAEKDSQHKEHLEQSLKDLEATKAAATKSGSEEAAALLEEQKTKHDQALKEIQEKFSVEQSKGSNATAKIESLTSEVSSLKYQLIERTKAYEEELNGEKTKLEAATTSNSEEMKLKKQDLSSVQNELRSLQARHRQEIEELEAARSQRIGEVEADYEESLKRIKDLEGSYESSQKRILELETAAGSVSSQYSETLSAKDEEIEKLGKVIEGLQDEIQKSHETKERELESTRIELIQEHTAAINELQASHDQALTLALQEAKALATSSTKLVSEIESLKKEREEQTAEAASSRAEMQILVDTLQGDKESFIKARDELEQELEDAKAQILGLKKMLETFDQESQEKEQGHTSAMKKLKDELDQTIKILEDKTRESTSTLDKHTTELDAIRSSHAQKIEDMKADLEAQRQSTISEHDKLLGQTRETHQRDIKSMQEDHAKILTELQEQVVKHRNGLANVEKELHLNRETGSATLRELKDKHDAEVEELRTQLAKTKSDWTSAQERLESIKQQMVQKEGLEQQRSSEMESLQTTIAEDKVTIERLTQAAEDATRRMADTTEADKLKDEIASLTKAHEAKMAGLEQEMTTEAEKREKERKSGAEVRDNLLDQLEKLEHFRKLYPSTQEEVTRQQALARAAQDEIKALTGRLNEALDSSQRYQADHFHAVQELDILSAELESRSRGASEYKQDLDALQAMTDKQRGQNGKLKEQLEEATTTVERYAARIREVEAALKATDAEITELKTKGASARTPPIKGLGNSRWASESAESPTARGDAEAEPEGTEMGSYIEGAMAGLQAQIKLLESINEDMIGDHQRMVDRLYRPTSSGRNKPQDSRSVLSPIASSFKPMASSE